MIELYQGSALYAYMFAAYEGVKISVTYIFFMKSLVVLIILCTFAIV